MKVKNIYPQEVKKTFKRKKFINVARWPYLSALVACPIVNLLTGGPYWFIVADFLLFITWTMFINTDLIEYNRISQFIKGTTYLLILLTLIDVILAPGWAITVVPIVCFGGLVVSATLFYTDFERQKHNLMPLLLLTVASLIASIVCLSAFEETRNWEIIVMGSVSVGLIISFIITLGSEFIKELKRRFHV